MFRRTERLVSSLQLGGYRANVVAYVISLLSERSRRHLDLESIWRHQRLSAELGAAVLDLAPRVRSILLDAPGHGNVTEWAKKPACWERVLGMSSQLPDVVMAQLASPGNGSKEPEAAAINVVGLSAEAWARLAEWAELTGHLSPFDRRTAGGMITLMRSAAMPTDKQNEVATRIYESAVATAFPEEQWA